MTEDERLIYLEEFARRLEERIKRLEEEASFAYIQEKIKGDNNDKIRTVTSGLSDKTLFDKQ